MRLTEWDEELNAIAKELQSIRTAHSRNRLTNNKQLVLKKLGTIQSQMNLSSDIETIQKLTKRQYLLLPKEKTVLHWTAVFAEKMQEYFSMKSKQFTARTWMKLIQIRISDSSSVDSDDIETEQIIGLAVRQSNLLKTERFLSQALITAKEAGKKLSKRYYELDIVRANKVASGSMAARLGQNPESALNSPAVKALEGFFMKAIASLNDTAQSRQISDYQKKYSGKVSGLMDTCKDMLIESLESPESGPSPESKVKFEATLQHLRRLDSDTEKSYNRLVQGFSNDSQAMLVKKKPNQATTTA